jgi:tetratricopeptide (TPR) repeat protein
MVLERVECALCSNVPRSSVQASSGERSMRIGWCLLVVCLTAPLFGGCDAKRAEALQLVEKGIAIAAEDGEFEAEKLFSEAANVCPDCGEAHLNRGILQLQHYRNPSEAVGSLERATKLLPTDVAAHYYLGVALQDLGKSAPAEAAFGEALKINAGHALSLLHLGQLMEAADKPLEAASRYNAAIVADGYLAQAYVSLGSLYARYGRFADSKAVFDNGLANNSGSPALMAAAGYAALSSGDTDRAIDLLKKGFEAGDTSPSTPYNLGVAYGRRFDATGDQEARRYAVAALTRAQTSCKAATDAARCAATRDRIARLELLKPN